MIALRQLAIVALGFGVSCSSSHPIGPTAPLDCAWLADETNCWQKTLDQIALCVPTGETGMLGDNVNAGRPLPQKWRSCDYPSGAKVTFHTPLPPLDVQTMSETTFDFTIANGGRDCVRVATAANSFKVVVDGKMVAVETDQGIPTRVTCPDGTSYWAPMPLELVNCKGADGGYTFDALPKWEEGFDSSTISFGLIGGRDVQLFDCKE